MITLLTKDITPRLEYMALFLQNQLGTPVILTNDINEKKGVLIAYQEEPIEEALNIVPHGLLHTAVIDEQKPEVEWMDEVPYFFRTQGMGEMPCDILASIFYMVTRYEELTTKDRDEHDRFKAVSSLAYKGNFITRPVVEIWLAKLKSLLAKKGDIPYKAQKYKFVPTVDVDSAYAFKYKPLYLQLAGLLRRLAKGQIRLFFEQLLVHIGHHPDPYNTYAIFKQSFNKPEIKPHFFVQVGNRGLHDKNMSYKNSAFREVVDELKTFASVGLHVSYQGAFDHQIIREECHKLQDMTGEIVTRNRFHYLRMNLPESYALLENNGINADYTMGYADHIGYRAGISKPYLWFDLKANRTTSLKVHPFFAMDNSLRKYMACTPSEAIAHLKPALEEIKSLNGQFCFLWHNSSFLEVAEWKGWRVVYNWLMQNG